MKEVPVNNRGELSLEYKVHYYVDYLVDKGIGKIHLYPSAMSNRVGCANIIVKNRIEELKKIGIDIKIIPIERLDIL